MSVFLSGGDNTRIHCIDANNDRHARKRVRGDKVGFLETKEFKNKNKMERINNTLARSPCTKSSKGVFCLLHLGFRDLHSPMGSKAVQ